MAEKSRPDPSNGTVIDADEYEAMMLGASEDGVIGTPSDPPVVYADATGRQVKIRAGRIAMVRGYTWWSDPVTDDIFDNNGAGLPANTSGNPRIDRLVLRLDRTTRQIRLAYIQGTPAAQPQPPALTQDTGLSSGVWDFPLARWPVAAGYTTIAAPDIITEAWCRAADGTVQCTSTSRPFGAYLTSRPRIYEIDTLAARQWDGAAWQLFTFCPPFLFAHRDVPAVGIANNTTFQDDDKLFVTVPPNSIWDVDAHILYSSDVVADLRIAWSGPPGATFDWSAGGTEALANGGGSGMYYAAAFNITESVSVTGGGVGFRMSTRPKGRLIVGPTGGIFRFRWTQGTSNTNGTSPNIGSYLTLRRVG